MLTFASAHMETLTLIREDVQGVDIVVRLSAHHRMHTAGIISDHAAERAVGMCGRIGGEGEMMPLGGITQLVEHDTRQHARGLRNGIEFYNRIEILRTVD